MPTELMLGGGFLLLLIAVVLVSKWWGHKSEQNKRSEERLEAIGDKKKVVKDVRKMSDEELLDLISRGG